MLKIPNIDLSKIKFSAGDRLIELNFLIKDYPDEFVEVSNLTIKNLNKNVFYKTVNSIEKLKFDFSLFEERKWFDEISVENFSFRTDDTDFATGITLKKLEFKDFSKNTKLIQDISNKLGLKTDEINYLSALLSFSLNKVSAVSGVLEVKNNRSISWDYFDISNFSLLDWGKWTIKNYHDFDYNLDMEVSYAYSDLQDVRFDKDEIIKAAQNFDQNNFNIENNYKIFFNMIDSLGSGKTQNIIVKDLSTKNQIASIKSIILNSFKFGYIDDNQKQKFLTDFDFNLEGLDLNIQEISPEFSSYFKLLGYDNVKFDFGSNYDLEKNKDLSFDIDLGITDAASIKFSSIFSGFDLDQITNLTNEALLLYFSSNFKIKEVGLSLIDNSLRDKLFKFAAQQQNTSVDSLKTTLIKQMDAYLVTTQKTRIFNQYRQSVIKFINGSKRISITVSPQTPLSIIEISPYLINHDVNMIINKLNLNISN